MANRERAELTVEVEGQVYRLQLSINGMCEVEDLLSVGGKRVSFNTFLTDYLPQGTYRDLRMIVWAGLREHHPEFTLGQAGWLIDRVGWSDATAVMLQLIHGTQPDPQDLHALGVATDRPPTARQDGIGGPSKSRRARSGSPATPSGPSRSASSSVSS